MKVTVEGDRVELSARVDDDSGDLTISVEDSGPGIPPAQRVAVLARFARPGARDEDGSGLGLAIVRAVAQAHGGHVFVGDVTSWRRPGRHRLARRGRASRRGGVRRACVDRRGRSADRVVPGKGLRAEGYVTTVAANVFEASAFADAIGPDLGLLLLDLGLPDGSGEDVLRRVRQKRPELSVIILTARADVSDKVRGLDLGANDYVTKPFAFEELLARIRAAFRTSGQPAATELVIDDLRLDLLTKVAWRGGQRIDLAPREWALLELFMRNPTHVLTRQRILNQVWDYGFDAGSNVVDVYVGYLRRKINRAGARPLIQTVRGAGYRLLGPD